MQEILAGIRRLELIDSVKGSLKELLSVQQLENPTPNDNLQMEKIIEVIQDKSPLLKELSPNDADKIDDLKDKLPVSVSEFETFLDSLQSTFVANITDALLQLDFNQISITKPDSAKILPRENLEDYLKRINKSVIVEIDSKQIEIYDCIEGLKKLFGNIDQNIDHPKSATIKERYEQFIQILSQQKDQYNAIKDEVKKDMLELLTQNQKPLEPNSIVVYHWVPRPSATRNQILGFDSTGHISVAIRRKKIIDGKEQDETVYVSLWPNKNSTAQASWLEDYIRTNFRKLGMPSPTTNQGYFGTFSADLYKMMVIGDFTNYNTVVFKCDEEPCLNIDAAFDTAKAVLSNKNQKFNFYTDNCAAIGLVVLRGGECEKILPFPALFQKIIAAGEFYEYSKKLYYTQEQQQLHKGLSTVLTDKAKVLKNLLYLKKCIQVAYTKDTFSLEESKFLKVFAEPISDKLHEFINNIEQSDDLVEIYKIQNQALENLHNIVTSEYKKYFARNFIEQIKPVIKDFEAHLPTAILNDVNRIISTLELKIQDELSKIAHENNVKDFYIKCHNAFQRIDNLVNQEVVGSISNSLLKITTELQNIIDIIPTQLNSIQHQHTPEQYEIIKSSITNILARFQSTLGEINQLFYFDTTKSLDIEDNNNLFKRLQHLLSGIVSVEYPSVKELVKDMVNQFSGDDDIKAILQNSDSTFATYQERRDGISNIIDKIIENMDKEDKEKNTFLQFFNFQKNQDLRSLERLHIKAQLILAMQTFIQGEMSANDLQSTLRDIANAADNMNDRNLILLFVESFHIQSYVGDINWNQSKHDFTSSTIFKYYNPQDGNIITSNNPREFCDMLSVNVTPSMLKTSSYNLIELSINSVVSNSNYEAILKQYSLKQFKDAMQIGFDRKANNNANKLLFNYYNHLRHKNLYNLLPAEAAFLNLYEGIELITDILNHNYSLEETKTKLDKYTDNHKKYDKLIPSATLINDMNHFYDTLFSAAFTKHCREEARKELIISDLAPKLQSLKNRPLNIDNANLANHYNVVVNTLEKITNKSDMDIELLNLHKSIKDSLYSISPQEALYDDILSIEKDMREILKIVNKEIYLEDNALKASLSKFFDIPFRQTESIDILLEYATTHTRQEAKQQTNESSNYKLIVIQMIKDFMSGKLKEEEFYYLLSSFIDDNSGSLSLPVWPYNIAYNKDVVNKGEHLSFLKDFRKGFISKFVNLEAYRLETTPDIKYQTNELAAVLQAMQEQSNEEVKISSRSIKSRAKQDYDNYPWYEKNKRSYAKSLEKFTNILSKQTKNQSKEKTIKDNLKLDYHVKRLSDLHKKKK